MDASGYRSPRARLGVGAVILLVLLALAVTIAIGVWRGAATPREEVASAPPAASGDPSGAATVAADPGVDVGLYVHVSGAVRAPGLYVLAAGARVVDAVSAAGGWADDAEQSGVNLARHVVDGEQVVVPRIGEPVQQGGDGAGTAAGPVNLNTADQAELEELPRIGPALAERIIAWREENGPFTAVEDLLAVSGIGEKMLETLRSEVTV